ncbi:methyl-accepting chemotaxis protein [Virgibacillus sp. C22-A2]|uniref:Methyl-accepting chemotaxis protein n=1 Tax=Virgibacillus tibetensis TaxID=3042313 RepID=A0ABU6KFN5_9BACI|nr:methyl-accepting chemotaxis protein [Virgibacillus sp. C22-A2]
MKREYAAKDYKPEKGRKKLSYNILKKLSLRSRLLIIFISLLIICSVAVGLSSYIKAKEMTMNSIENRLGREAEIMSYIADNLKFLYVSDESYFMQQLEVNIRNQHDKLKSEGIDSEFFYVTNNEAIPFKLSNGRIPVIKEAIIEDINEKNNGILHETIEGVDYTLSVQNMKEINGAYVMLVPTDSYMGPVIKQAYFTLGIIIASVVITSIVILLFVRSLTNPLTVLRQTMKEVRNGNLSKSVTLKTTLPEFISLHKSYNAMINHMRSMLNEIREATTNIEYTGGELQRSSEGTLVSSKKLIEAIHVVKNGAEQTASSSENSMESFKTMKSNTEDMITNMGLIFKSSEEMNLSAKKGDTNITNLINTIQTFEKDFEHLTATIKQVQNYSNSITELVGLIQGIAKQTKLLSLNASIEAARAGDSGKGFAVVANEVGKLATESSGAAEQITESISNMELITNNASKEFEQMLIKIKTNLRISNESKNSIDELMVEISEVSSKLHEMRNELKGLGGLLPELEKDAVDFSSVSQETLASALEMLASSERQIKQIENTYGIGLKLTGISKSLTGNTKKFAIK